jgi:glycosyltransferase involved in cell wall biosynthesis
MKSQPRVSIVVPSYNYGRYVGQAINSLLAQTLSDLEIVVIDDCSSDETAVVLAAYSTEARVRVIRHESNQGHIRSYNEGLAATRGEYVGLLSADDYAIATDVLARQAEVFDANPRVGLVYTAHVLVEQGGRFTESVPWKASYVQDGLIEFGRLMWSNYVPASGTLLRREVQAALGPYDVRLPHSGDWDLWLRAAANWDVGYLAQPMYAYRMHEVNMSHNQIRPEDAADELLFTIDKAFEALPANSPIDLIRRRADVRRHALLQSAWVDLYHGRRKRSWRGLAHAVHVQPGILSGTAFWGLLARLLIMTFAGRRVARAAGARLELIRRRSPQRA